MNRSLLAGTSNFIRKSGSLMSVEATFLVAIKASIGDSTIILDDALGLFPGSVLFLTSSKPIVVLSIALNTLTVKRLSFEVPAGSLLTNVGSPYGLFIAPGRDINRDTREFNRRIRLPRDTVVAYGAIVTHETNQYFVSAFEYGDSSLSVGLKFINTHIDWYSKDPDFDESATPATTDLSDWPEYPDTILISSSIPAYEEQVTSYTRLEEAGYLPTMSKIMIAQKWYQVQIGDLLVSNGVTLRVIGKDLARIRNMQALQVDYYKGETPNA